MSGRHEAAAGVVAVSGGHDDWATPLAAWDGLQPDTGKWQSTVAGNIQSNSLPSLQSPANF